MGLRVVVRRLGSYSPWSCLGIWGFEVVYVNPVNRLALAEIGINDLREEFLKLIKELLHKTN